MPRSCNATAILGSDVIPAARNSATTGARSVVVSVIGQGVFHGRADDRAYAISVYEKNNAEVRKAFSRDRLLVFELGAGWEPLCKFLGAPVPHLPFPKTNSARPIARWPCLSRAWPRRA
jgi:Sulfotransferase domain